MLDFNARPKIQEQISELIDAALTRERAGQTPRDYLGASRLGVSCERALQYEYTHTPVDDGRDFSGRLLRIFEVGHTLEDLAIGRSMPIVPTNSPSGCRHAPMAVLSMSLGLIMWPCVLFMSVEKAFWQRREQNTQWSE